MKKIKIYADGADYKEILKLNKSSLIKGFTTNPSLMRKSEVKKYYDNYINEQYSIGVNDRIFLMYEKLKSLGLSSTSSVIELGCGIGVVTHLIRKTVTVGKIESIDIDDESDFIIAQSLLGDI